MALLLLFVEGLGGSAKGPWSALGDEPPELVPEAKPRLGDSTRTEDVESVVLAFLARPLGFLTLPTRTT